MGNTATKEARSSYSSPRYGHSRTTSIGGGRHPDEAAYPGESSRQRRDNRPDLSFLGISTNDASLENRRETRQEREARKREKERVARLKERDRSMKEEHVDGGYLVTQGVYVGTEDYSKSVVRQLMIERRLAPFWRGLNDFSDSWAEHQIMAAARGLPIPPADQVPPELEYKITTPPSETHQPEKNVNNLTVPITSRSHSVTSDASNGPRLSPTRSQSPTSLSPPGSNLFRGRAKTLASLTTSSKSAASSEMSPRELQLPRDPFVNGQPIEVYLYKSPGECPICFLYYPPYLNKTRCCDQPICSECFVQIKRADPHPPEHEQPNASEQPQPERQQSEADGQLVSEPAACPFCVQPEFGVSYDPPPFRRGLTYVTAHPSHPLALTSSPQSSSSSLGSGNQPGGARRRATSLSADSPNVITTDKVRPDWAQKLTTARANAARRSAAATALHTAAYLVNSGNPSESRNLSSLGRRGVLRRATGQDSPLGRSGSPHLQALAHFAERHNAEHESDSREGGSGNLAPPRASSRRNRMEELENMMMMEAIRQSLAAEEERRKKEEKEAKKEAKRREKEAKKAEKHGKKNIVSSNNGSSAALGLGPSSSAGRSAIAPPPPPPPAQEDASGKGKGVDRTAPPPAGPESSAEPFVPSSAAHSVQDGSLPQNLTNPCTAESTKKLHIRHASSASSSNTSLESALSDQIGTGTPPHSSSSGLDPAFNFRSLAAMIGDEESMKEEAAQSENPIQGSSSNAFDENTQDNDEHKSSPHEPSAVDAKDIQTSSAEVHSEPSLRTAT